MNDYIGRLVKQFESGTKGSLALSSCGNDWGLSCGSYQLTLRWGNCISFLKKYYPVEASDLYFSNKPDIVTDKYPGKEYCSSVDTVKAVWTECYNKNPDIFVSNEHLHIKSMYYDKLMVQTPIQPSNRALQECFWSWAVHKGVSGALAGLDKLRGIGIDRLFDAVYDYRYSINKFERYGTGSGSEREILRSYLNWPVIGRGDGMGTAMRKASELVEFAERAFKEKWGYVWGGSGEVYTKDAAEKLYGKHKTSKYDKTYYLATQIERWEGRRVCDCSGLLRAFGASGTADDMYKKSTSNGRLDTCSLLPGTLIFCQGTDGKMNHVGVMVADSQVIHSTNSKDGVVKEKLSMSTRGWTHWGTASFIDYGDAVVGTSQQASIADKPTLRKGSTGDAVKELQGLLNQKIDAGLVVDGIFGTKTHTAITTYQLKNNLAMDGIVGSKTWGALLRC